MKNFVLDILPRVWLRIVENMGRIGLETPMIHHFMMDGIDQKGNTVKC